MGKNAYDLIKEAAKFTTGLAVPMGEQLQANLRSVVRVLEWAYLAHGNVRKTLRWYRHGTVATLGHRTPE